MGLSQGASASIVPVTNDDSTGGEGEGISSEDDGTSSTSPAFSFSPTPGTPFPFWVASLSFRESSLALKLATSPGVLGQVLEEL